MKIPLGSKNVLLVKGCNACKVLNVEQWHFSVTRNNNSSTLESALISGVRTVTTSKTWVNNREAAKCQFDFDTTSIGFRGHRWRLPRSGIAACKMGLLSCFKNFSWRHFKQIKIYSWLTSHQNITERIGTSRSNNTVVDISAYFYKINETNLIFCLLCLKNFG